ncbi:hypothetical protein Rsub_12352 [Raphidocelis subcapitata]|uniref:Uncharacterized protein n=1 Tax=Raphidocelis subcapitata TaxID=307507 RepID=A0A2V0PIK6_9CHLO|nr:hypothetical protein Rsub_12352 [Raphidocelis subcapitata]|eukprot:GBF99546.1 hypothetical protein Rsub_12352 [Raphidocelis subcapitata]
MRSGRAAPLLGAAVALSLVLLAASQPTRWPGDGATVRALRLLDVPGCQAGGLRPSMFLIGGLDASCRLQGMIGTDESISVTFVVPPKASAPPDAAPGTYDLMVQLRTVGGLAELGLVTPQGKESPVPDFLGPLPAEYMAKHPGSYTIKVVKPIGYKRSTSFSLQILTPLASTRLVDEEVSIMADLSDQCCPKDGSSNGTALGFDDFCSEALASAISPSRTLKDDLCRLAPITCTSDGRIQQLALPGVGLDCRGKGLPPSFSGLSALQTLDLAFNSIGGSADDLAEVLGAMPSLRRAFLRYTDISGVPPCGLVDNPSLVLLSISGNPKLTGTMPACYLNDATLEELYFSQTGLTGRLPNVIPATSPLRVLFAIGTAEPGAPAFSGPIPTTLSNARNLTQLDLSNNALEGPIPPLPPALQLFNGSANKLTSIPALPDGLAVFDASFNELVGTVPSVGPNLELLALDSNKLSGPLPELRAARRRMTRRLAQVTALGPNGQPVEQQGDQEGDAVDAGDQGDQGDYAEGEGDNATTAPGGPTTRSPTGVIPPTRATNPTGMVGPTGTSGRGASTATVLGPAARPTIGPAGPTPPGGPQPGDDAATGNGDYAADYTADGPGGNDDTPAAVADKAAAVRAAAKAAEAEVAGAPQLRAVFMAGNRVSGTIPASWATVPKRLEALDLAGNQLTGPLPDKWALPRLYIMGVRDNQLKGTIPTSLAKLPTLVYLDARNNSFGGDLTPLAQALAANGSAPLMHLDLSANKFEGEIPQAFAEAPMFTTPGMVLLNGFPARRTLNLGNNSFSGAFPTWLVDALPAATNSCSCLVAVRVNGPQDSLECPSAAAAAPLKKGLDEETSSLLDLYAFNCSEGPQRYSLLSVIDGTKKPAVAPSQPLPGGAADAPLGRAGAAQQAQAGGGGGPNPGTVAGAVIGSVGGVGLLGAAAVLLARRSQRLKRAGWNKETLDGPPGGLGGPGGPGADAPGNRALLGGGWGARVAAMDSAAFGVMPSAGAPAGASNGGVELTRA